MGRPPSLCPGRLPQPPRTASPARPGLPLNLWEARTIRRNASAPELDDLAVEEPLELRVESQALVVTMRTPGHDLDFAAGFLLTEGIIEDRDDLSALEQVAANVVDCRLASGAEAHRAALAHATRELLSTSACGLCGKTSLDQVRVKATLPLEHVHFSDAALLGLPDQLRALQTGFERTGGLHGAALVNVSASLLCTREDIGRHNAVDKVIGWRVRSAHQEPVALLVSSRASFEIVQKACVAGIGTVIAVGAASTLAVDLAVEQGMSIYGFVRDASFVRYG